MSGEDPSEVGEWVKQRVLGSGGFGVVTLWKHKAKENEMIALKKCRWGTDQLLTAKHKERWSKEVEIMQRLAHPNVVRAITVPPELQDALKSELPMLCMEFCARGDLRQVLNRSENCCGLLEPEVRALISDISSAVKYLHYMKITHRDLKPENIVLQSGEQRVYYKLIDLGYAKELDQSSICTSFVGTLQYLAPELFMNKNYSCSVDYWSLGLVSHEVITGVRPFLPSMAPVSWMSHVGNKSGDDICAYQALDGTIVFGKELFPQNHISSCLKYYMEKWLKACLEWDAKKRGRYDKEVDGEIIVFNLIDDILNKTMLNVYDAINYQMLSYEIEHSTAVKTLQRWIERDTGLIIEKQELLLPDGSNVDLEKEAWSCISTHNLNQEPRVFVYKRGTLCVPEVTPQIPASVSAMMQDPRSLVPYAHQIRAYAHAVFFLNQEQRLYKTFRHAAAVKLLRLCNSSNSLRQELSSVNMLMHQTEAQHSLNDTALEFDQNHALKLSAFPVNVVQGWKKRNGLIKRQLEKLKEAVDHLKVRCESHFRKTRELGSSASDIDNVDLQSSLKSAMACYESLKRRPKEKRHQQSDSVEMVKIVYNCLKTRDKLLRDENFNAYLRRIVTLQEDIGKLIGPVHSSAEMVARIKTDLGKAFRERQTDIWNHFLQICNQSKDATTSMKPSLMHPSQSLSNLPKFSQSSQVSLTNISTESLSMALPSPAVELPPALPPKPPTPAFKVGAPVPNGQIVFNIRGGNTADDMINDNIALRYATQDLMQESFAHYRSLLEENRSLDWSFMK